MKITIETRVDGDAQTVWQAWTTPADIMQWNAASDDWHTTASTVDLRVGGRFTSRMEAKDGSMGFDFAGTYTRVEPPTLLAYRLEDDREVTVAFIEDAGDILVRETFDAETVNDPEMQRQGWQAILDRFARYIADKMKQ